MALLNHRPRSTRAGNARGRGFATVSAALLCMVLALVPARGGRSLTAVEVRAGFLYNFARFVEWPEETGPGPGHPFVFVVLGDPGLARALESGLAGKRLRGHPVLVRDARGLGDLEGAHVLWVGRRWEGRLGEVLARVGGRPVLTVSEIPGFAGRGGLIELYRVGSRFRFLVDERAAERAGLRVSSRLLTLSRPRPRSSRR